MKIYLVRHGKTDYSEKNTKIYQGFGVNLAPLAEQGIRQLKKTARDPRLKKAGLIVSSPYTRALQSAAILSKKLKLDIAVETGLHEWLADKTYQQYAPDEQAEEFCRRWMENGGEYPGQPEQWEDAQAMRQRALAALERYRGQGPVIAVCHGMLIQALSGQRIETGGIVQIQI